MLRTCALLATLALAAAARGQNDPPLPPDPVLCTVEGSTVTVHWGKILWLLPIQGYTVQKDFEKCDPGMKCFTLLPPEAEEYVDKDVAPGKHIYIVSAINWDGGIGEIGRCTVEVGPVQGLTCEVDGRVVHLKWQPLLIDVVVRSFDVYRGGDLVAKVPGNQFAYDDVVPTIGEYTYRVVAVFGENAEALVGSCQVAVSCFGLTAAVDGLNVLLEWPIPLAGPIAFVYVVSRDGQPVGKTGDGRYKDTVPGPGTYLYEVWRDPPEGMGMPSVLIAVCKVVVPGSGLPPPRDLTCEVLPTIAIFPPPPPAVGLTWVNGADYLSILILRDDGFLAGLPGGPAGETRRYVDQDVPAGQHTYCVLGALSGVISEPACCKVVVPGDGVPPVEALTCEAIVGETPPGTDPGTGIDPPVPLFRIALRWTNPVAYDKILIIRNNMPIASLEGTVTEYLDHVAGGGLFTYEVYGILMDRRSPPAACTVEVPPGDVPPPQDLACFLVTFVPRPDDPDVLANGLGVSATDPIPFPAVYLKWWNPIRYDSIVIYRDRGILANLPGGAMMFRDINPPAGRHLYGVRGVLADGRQSDLATCWVDVGDVVPPVEELTCWVNWDSDPSSVGLSWKNPVAYDGIAILRNMEPLITLPGDAAGYRDVGLAAGVYIYEVVGIIGNLMSAPATCQVVIEGPPQKDVLYFSTGVLQPGNNWPPAASSRITCLLNNSAHVQGWSFGVGTDPKFIVPVKYDIGDTVTAKFHGGAGPDFLTVNLLPEGLTMAVVIETFADPSGTSFETLPPGTAQPIINIDYEAGPSGTSGEVYPVRYTDALGSPPVQVLLVVGGFEVRPATLPGSVAIPVARFLRSDVNGSGKVDITDGIFLLNWLFLDGKDPGCLEAADMNGSGNVNIADPVYILSFLFVGGHQPPWPFPECGPAPTPLGCKDPGSCK